MTRAGGRGIAFERAARSASEHRFSPPSCLERRPSVGSSLLLEFQVSFSRYRLDASGAAFQPLSWTPNGVSISQTSSDKTESVAGEKITLSFYGVGWTADRDGC